MHDDDDDGFSHFFFLSFFSTVRVYRLRLYTKKEVIFGSRNENDKKRREWRERGWMERDIATARIVYVFYTQKKN